MVQYKQLKHFENAGVAELADALDLGSNGTSCAGSSPVARTMSEQTSYRLLRLFYKKSERTHFAAHPFQRRPVLLGS